MPITTEIEPAAIREHYDRLSPLYERFWGEHVHHGFWRDGESPAGAQVKLVEELARRAGISRGARVLDVGSGLGGPACWLARQRECSVHGITLSPVQAKAGTRRAKAQGLEARVVFEVHDANELDFPAESFDVVWTVECSEHLFDKADFFRRCARVLRPGGKLAVAAWLARSSSPEGEQRVRRISRAMLCPSLGSLQDYTGWIQASGFERIVAEDVAADVAKTWIVAAAILRRPEVKLLLRAGNAATREFARAFSEMREAYALGAMGYGFLVAHKPSEASFDA